MQTRAPHRADALVKREDDASKRRLTKKARKLMESQSQHRTIVDIISDTKSGEPLRSEVEAKEKRKREKESQSQS